jgi:hypothetical protein
MGMQERTCIDLQERFGDRYKIGKDPSYFAEHGPNAWTHDPWLLLIRCERGEIYPHGGDYLAFATNGRGPSATKLAELACVEVLQDGDDGINGKFHVDHFREVAKLMRPRRRHVLSAERRARMSAIGTAALAKYREGNSQADKIEQESLRAG